MGMPDARTEVQDRRVTRFAWYDMAINCVPYEERGIKERKKKSHSSVESPSQTPSLNTNLPSVLRSFLALVQPGEERSR